MAKRVTITLASSGRRVRLRIVDDGKGIGTLSPRRSGLGLRIMQYRAGLLRGAVSVHARFEGGTEVCCTAPAQMLRTSEEAHKTDSKFCAPS